MIRAVIYARFSSDNQRDESIDAQLRLCHEYADKMGYVVVNEYCDYAVTGRTDERKYFQQMLADAKAGVFDVAIIDVVDRFSRDKVDSGWHKRYLRKKLGIRVEYASQRIDDTPEGKLLEGILEDIAQFHSSNLARETMKGLTENALKGWHTGGPPGFGFALEEIPGTRTKKHPNGSKRYILNEAEASVVYRVCEIYDAGGTYDGIEAATHDDMIRLRGRPLSKHMIYEILRREKNTGTYIYRKGTKKDHRQTREDVIRVPGVLPVIVPRDMWERIQAKLDSRGVNPGRRAANKAKREFLLSGIIFCGECGSGLVGNHVKSFSGKKHYEYAYYSCVRHRETKKCNLKTIKADFIEQITIEDIKLNYFSPEGKAILLQKFQDYLATRPNLVKADLERTKKEIAVLDKKINNTLKAIEDGISTPSVMGRLSQHEQQRIELGNKVGLLMAKQEPHITIEEIETYLKDAEEQFQSCNDPKRIKQLIQRFVDSVVVSDEGIEVILKIKISPDDPGSPQGTHGDFLDTGGSDFLPHRGKMPSGTTRARRHQYSPT